MSVAFRRNGDEEHLEPRFDLPIPPGPNLVTPRGLALIAARVDVLEAQLPTLTDEAELTIARRQLRYWRQRQGTAHLMPRPDGARVTFGCTVRLLLAGKTRKITPVGDDEADPAAGLLAFSAPLARAVMTGEVGEFIDFAGRAEAIEILAISVD